MVEHGIGKKPFQTRFLALKALQPLGVTDIHAAILGFPLVNGRIADPVLTAQISDGNAGLVLL
jgi:hypothetical protein